MKIAKVRFLALLALFPVLAFAATANAAKIELRNKKALQSSILETLREDFERLVDDSEQATYEKDTAVSRGAKFAFVIVSQKPEEELGQVIKQAFYKGRPQVGQRKTEVSERSKVQDAVEELIGETVDMGMSWNDGSEPDSFRSSLIDAAKNPEIYLFKVISKGVGGTDYFTVIFDLRTNEALAIGSEFDAAAPDFQI